MNFISSSQDIFYLVLAFCILWITVFLAWLMYYAIQAVRQLYQAVTQIKAKIDAVDEVIRLIKEKLTSSASYLTLIVGGVKKVVELLAERQEKKKRAKRS